MNRIELKNKKLEEACRAYNVKELYVFGSFVTGGFKHDSDLDFLVEFKQDADIGAFEQFMGFKEKLEQIFERPIDLLTVRKFRNPVFNKEIHQSKSLVYAAPSPLDKSKSSLLENKNYHQKSIGCLYK